MVIIGDTVPLSVETTQKALKLEKKILLQCEPIAAVDTAQKKIQPHCNGKKFWHPRLPKINCSAEVAAQESITPRYTNPNFGLHIQVHCQAFAHNTYNLIRQYSVAYKQYHWTKDTWGNSHFSPVLSNALWKSSSQRKLNFRNRMEDVHFSGPKVSAYGG